MTVTIPLRVTAIRDDVPGIRFVELCSASATPLPSFPPGNHIVLSCGEDRRNAYSLVTSGRMPARYGIAVLRQTGGRGGSAWIHRELAVGQVVEANPPRSCFGQHASARHHLFIAGGIGITPFVSHVREAVQWGCLAPTG